MAILVCPLSRVAHMVETRQPGHVVSLLDPHTPFPSPKGLAQERHLRLNIHDIAEHEPGLTAPGEVHVQDIIAFISTWERTAPILIHCYAGISRSTATAFITACVHNPGADEGEIAWAVRAASPTATPNPRLVALADAELGRGGRMVRAVSAIGRGNPSWPDIPEARPFEIPAQFGSAD